MTATLPSTKNMLADVFLASWFSTHQTKGLLRDVFDVVLARLRNSWASWDLQKMDIGGWSPDQNDIEILRWRDSEVFFEDVWECMKARSRATENPLGVLSFDSKWSKFAGSLIQYGKDTAPGWFEQLTMYLKEVSV